MHLTIHDAADGKLLWSCGEFNPMAKPLWPAVASPAVVDEMAVVCFGRADKGSPRLHGIKLEGSGDVTATNRVWFMDDVGAFVPTPVEYKGRVYILNDRGQIARVDPKTGASLWTNAFPKAGANFYASPVIANGVMYAAREDGSVYCAKVDGDFELLSEKNSTTISSPRLYPWPTGFSCADTLACIALISAGEQCPRISGVTLSLWFLGEHCAELALLVKRQAQNLNQDI